MSNIVVSYIPYYVQGDGTSLTVTIPLGFTPAAVQYTAMITHTGQDVTGTILSVVISGQSVVVTFASSFTYLLTVFLSVTPAVPLLVGSVQSTVPWIVSLGSANLKTVVTKTGSLTTASVTANQVVLTYTVTAGKIFYLQYFKLAARLTTFPGNANPIQMGTVSLENPSGIKIYTGLMHHPTMVSDMLVLDEPVPILAGIVIRVVVTPDTATSLLWYANFGGYEK